MRAITGLIFILNFAAWIVFDIICWQLTGETFGWIVLFGTFTFIMAWALSGEAIIAPLDYIMQPDWGIFTLKFKWANSAGFLSMGILSLLCILFDWLNLRAFLGFS